MEIKNFWVDIEDSSGNRIGRGPLRASQFRHTSRLSACGEFSFVLSSADPNLAALAEKRIAVCKYIDRDGALQTFGGGVIDKIVHAIQADGTLTITVSGNDLGRELAYRSVGALDLSGVGGAGVTNGPTQVVALAPAGWSITDGTTLASVYAGYDGESVLSALIGIGEHIGEHWRLGAGRVVEWLGPASTFAASGVRAVQHVNDPVAAETVDDIALISSLEEESDAADLLSRIIPRGAGNGGVVLTLAAATDSAPSGYTLSTASNYVKRDASEITYGRIEKVIDLKNIGPISNTTADIQAAANMLLKASVEYLRRYGTPQKFYRVGLAKVGQILEPGTTLRVVYRSLVDGTVVYDLDGTYNIVQAEREITAEGISTTSVVISTIDRMPMTDSDYLAQQAINAKVLSAHQQLGASVDTFTYRDELDNLKGASFRFWLGDEYTSIQRAVLRFRIQPLRSTVKSVAGSSTTTSSGGGSTSGSGGASTPTSGTENTNHSHGISVNAGTILYDLGISSLGALVATGGFSGTLGAAVQNNSTNHTHNVSVPNHTHSTPDHSHSLTPNISMQYGIYEESGANTLALANLVIKLNGGADLNAAVISISGGWYELDITDELVDAVFRPNQENNEIAITTAVAKTARIEAQITVRGVVQAVAYS
jgi:hypothetical protein